MKKSLAFFLALFIFAGCLPSHAAGLVWIRRTASSSPEIPTPKKIALTLTTDLTPPKRIRSSTF